MVVRHRLLGSVPRQRVTDQQFGQILGHCLIAGLHEIATLAVDGTDGLEGQIVDLIGVADVWREPRVQIDQLGVTNREVGEQVSPAPTVVGALANRQNGLVERDLGIFLIHHRHGIGVRIEPTAFPNGNE